MSEMQQAGWLLFGGYLFGNLLGEWAHQKHGARRGFFDLFGWAACAFSFVVAVGVVK